MPWVRARRAASEAREWLDLELELALEKLAVVVFDHL
jgi:hypothetical protein